MGQGCRGLTGQWTHRQQSRVGVRGSDRLLADQVGADMTRVMALAGLGMLLVGSSYATQDDPHFTGKSMVMDGKDLSAARRSFEAGARSAWHSHENGQLLMVEDGRMRTQKKGGPLKELG